MLSLILNLKKKDNKDKKDNKILKSKQLKEKGKRIKCDGMLWTKICEEGCLCCV